MIDPMTILSVAEVAEYLRVDESTVRRLIAKGDIPSFNVAGQSRVQYGALVQWFQAEADTCSLEILRQEIQKPSTWRKALDGHPEFRDQILEGDHKEGTFGAFLKESALAEDDPFSDEENLFETQSTQRISSAKSTEDSPSTEGDAHEYLRRLSRRPVIAVMVAFGLGVVAIGAFTDALQNIIEFVGSLLTTLF